MLSSTIFPARHSDPESAKVLPVDMLTKRSDTKVSRAKSNLSLIDRNTLCCLSLSIIYKEGNRQIPRAKLTKLNFWDA